jgi:hypothetical protein
MERRNNEHYGKSFALFVTIFLMFSEEKNGKKKNVIL